MLNFCLEKSDEMPLSRQLALQIREQILRGERVAGDALPPSRVLAARLKIGRLAVKQAYTQLADEGFVETRMGAGTFVATLPTLQQSRQVTQPALSHWAERALQSSPPSQREHKSVIYDFGFNNDFPQIFPYDVWRKLLGRYLSTDDTMLARYGSAAGFAPLRSAIAAHLTSSRGVRCDLEQIVIVNGVQQAIDIIGRILLQPKASVFVESPGYIEAYKLLRVYGAYLSGFAVDDDGFPVEKLGNKPAKLAFVTPANQFPRGGTLPLPRRLQLIQWATTQNAYILEDDYDSELRYDGKQIGALQGLAPERVIYLGTFSKVLFPALRLAYVVLPHALIAPFLATKRLIDRGSPTLTQAAIADFLREGHFGRHVRRLRQTYAERRQRLVNALQTQLPNWQFSDVAAGLHVMARLPFGMDEGAVVKSAEKHQVGIYPAAPYALSHNPEPAVLLAFSGIDQERIVTGIERLSEAVQRL